MSVVVRNTPRTDLALVDALRRTGRGTATVHEAQGRTGLLASPSVADLPPAQRSPATRFTCTVAPGDNWTIHVAVEEAQPGDLLVVVPTSACDDGYVGDLLAEESALRTVSAAW